jgi:glutathione S-transferase
MLKLFGHPGSTCTRKVLTTLHETGTAFEFVALDFATGEHKQPAHLARQPFGQVPAINDDGFELYESRAICRYLNEKANGSLIPADAQNRALMEEWISIETSNFTGHAMKFVYEHIFKRPQGDEVLAKATAGLETALGVMEKRLAEKPYLAGDVFSIADIAFMPYVEYGMMTPAKEIYGKYPHFVAWWERVSTRPSWQKVAGKA